MKVIKDIAYGELNEELADLYIPDKDNFDTIVYFHGGGIVSGSKNDETYSEIARQLAENGYGVLSVDYRMYPNAKFPDFIIDCARSVAYAKNNVKAYGGSGKLYVSGQSAGAWMSLMLCLNRAYLEGVGVDADEIAGWVIDSAQTTSHFNVLQNEDKVNKRLQRIDERAPLFYVDEKTAFSRMLLIYYENDMPCRPEQNRLFWRTVKAFNKQADIEMLELKGRHCDGSSIKDDDGMYPYVKETLRWLEA